MSIVDTYSSGHVFKYWPTPREWIVVEGENRRNSVMVQKYRLSSNYPNIQVSHWGTQLKLIFHQSRSIVILERTR